MSNPREEILRLSSERLKNKVESIMLSINIILSNPENGDRQVDKVSELLIELAVAESALNHSKSLFVQCLELKLKDLESIKQEDTE